MLIGRCYRLAPLLLPPLVCAFALAAAEPPLSEEPRAALSEAFHRRYDCDSRQSLTLVLRAHGREFQRQKIGVATKFVDGRMRALGRFTDPPDLRDTAVLMLEGEDPSGSDQLFVFLPMLGRVRRVSGAQRGDSFMGTDLTYEDLQRPRVEDYTDFSDRGEDLEGEPVLVVIAHPIRGTYYDRIETWIARRDAAILRVRFFKQGSPEPFKIIETPRQVLIRDGENVVPKRYTVVNVSRKTETEVFVDQLELHAKTDDSAFTTNALAIERDVPKPAPSPTNPRGQDAR